MHSQKISLGSGQQQPHKCGQHTPAGRKRSGRSGWCATQRANHRHPQPERQNTSNTVCAGGGRLSQECGGEPQHKDTSPSPCFICCCTTPTNHRTVNAHSRTNLPPAVASLVSLRQKFSCCKLCQQPLSSDGQSPTLHTREPAALGFNTGLHHHRNVTQALALGHMHTALAAHSTAQIHSMRTM